MKIKQKPLKINIRKNKNGTYNLSTPDFSLTNVPEDKFDLLVCPFMGQCRKLKVKPDCNETFEKFVNHFKKLRRAESFMENENVAFRNYLLNVSNPREKFHHRALKGFLKGKRVLFLGAGPSLRENIEHIKKLKGKYFVIAGGTAITICAKEGIMPDMICAFDPYPHEFDRFKNLPQEFQEQVPLLASQSLETRCFDGYKGKVIVDPGLNHIKVGVLFEGPDVERTVPQGSVGVSTWMPFLCDFWGCKDLTYIGVDLAYHSDGTEYGKDYADMLGGETKLRREKGGIKTRQLWVEEADEIGQSTTELGINGSYYNLGLDINGWERKDIKDLFDVPNQTVDIPLERYTDEDAKMRQEGLENFISLCLEVQEPHDVKMHGGHPLYDLWLNSYDSFLTMQHWRTGSYYHSILSALIIKALIIANRAASGLYTVDSFVRPANSRYTLWEYANKDVESLRQPKELKQ